MKRIAGILLCWSLLASSAYGYYHWIHYADRFGPFVPIREKFDLTVLPDKTVRFYIAGNPPQLAPTDSFNGLISQIRSAALSWNAVETSELKVAFGGLYAQGIPQSSPGIEVVFSEDIPPGLLAMGAPVTRGDLTASPSGSFVPILRSVVTLRADLTQRPSFSEGFFQTVVHEFGHALGLQHALTSSAMSTEITRATSKARPLAADDAAGLSVLYPTPGFSSSTGTVTGRVTMGGAGVNLASVVAISLNGPVVSALTHPDGTFRMEGLPAGNTYYFYAHPLPPVLLGEVTPANIVYPVDQARQPIPASGAFETQFFPGTKDWTQGLPFTLQAGTLLENVNFQVQPRASVPLYAVQTFGFPGQLAVKPPFLSRGTSRPFLVTSGVGLMVNGSPAAGLTARLMHPTESLPSQPRAYPFDGRFAQIDVDANQFVGEGPRHLIFSVDNDIYVLPTAFHLVERQPPLITGIRPGLDGSGRRTAIISGNNLSASTRFLFDGAAGTILGNDETGAFIVLPPPALSNQQAVVAALNSDGQNSLHMQGDAPPTFLYEPLGGSTFFALGPASVPAGADTMIQIEGVGTGFVDGQTTVGFGSTDIAVRRVWVLSPNRLAVNISISPTAPAIATTVTITTGLRVVSQQAAFQIQPPNPRQIFVSGIVTVPVDGIVSSVPSAIAAGGAASLSMKNLLPEHITPALSVAINGLPAPVVSATASQILVRIPKLPPGPAVVQVFTGAEASLPIVMQVETPPPSIARILTLPNFPVDSSHPVVPGEMILVLVRDLIDTPTTDPQRVRVAIGGVPHQPLHISLFEPGVHQLILSVNGTVLPGAQVPVTCSIDGHASPPVLIPVR